MHVHTLQEGTTLEEFKQNSRPKAVCHKKSSREDESQATRAHDLQILETLGSSSWIPSAILRIPSISLLFASEDGTFPAIPVSGRPYESVAVLSLLKAARTSLSQRCSARDISYSTKGTRNFSYRPAAEIKDLKLRAFA